MPPKMSKEEYAKLKKQRLRDVAARGHEKLIPCFNHRKLSHRAPRCNFAGLWKVPRLRRPRRTHHTHTPPKSRRPFQILV